MMRPFSCAVCALNALQNSMMLTPCWPSAGPTGGAGFAWPPGICSLIIVRTFFAMWFLLGSRCQTEVWHLTVHSTRQTEVWHLTVFSEYLTGLVDLLDLVEAE